MKRGIVLYLIIIAILAISQALAFTISRPAGDIYFLFASILICISVTVIFYKYGVPLLALVSSILISFITLSLNFLFIYYFRDSVMKLNESFGDSFVVGFIIFFVVIPLTLISGIGTLGLRLARRP